MSGVDPRPFTHPPHHDEKPRRSQTVTGPCAQLARSPVPVPQNGPPQQGRLNIAERLHLRGDARHKDTESPWIGPHQITALDIWGPHGRWKKTHLPKSGNLHCCRGVSPLPCSITGKGSHYTPGAESRPFAPQARPTARVLRPLHRPAPKKGPQAIMVIQAASQAETPTTSKTTPNEFLSCRRDGVGAVIGRKRAMERSGRSSQERKNKRSPRHSDGCSHRAGPTLLGSPARGGRSVSALKPRSGGGNLPRTGGGGVRQCHHLGVHCLGVVLAGVAPRPIRRPIPLLRRVERHGPHVGHLGNGRASGRRPGVASAGLAPKWAALLTKVQIGPFWGPASGSLPLHRGGGGSFDRSPAQRS